MGNELRSLRSLSSLPTAGREPVTYVSEHL